MKIKNIIFYHKISTQITVACCAVCLGMLAFPTIAQAQDDETGNEMEAPVRNTAAAKKKVYPTRTIKGRVINSISKTPISGALVSAAGIEGYSVLTDDNGAYELKIPLFVNSVIVTNPSANTQHTGLSKEEQQVDITLYPKTFAPDYQDAVNLRNDKSATDFQYTGAVNIKDEIQKQLGAYAYTTSRNGTPGIGSNMFIQGLNSLNVNAQPLVVVDGVIVDQQYGRTMIHDGFFNDILTNINPADIDNVTVMRNGTALYGAKGANGVIIVDTRRSKSMATRITASVSAGVTLLPKFISMMDADQYRGYASELLKTTNTTIRDFKFLNEHQDYYYYKQYHNNTDWKDLVYRNALTTNYGINVEGGDNIASYNLSVGYTQANSTLEYNNMNRLNIRFNTDINLIEKLSVRFDASFSNLTRDIRDDGAPENYTEGTSTSPSFLGYVKSPFLSPYAYGRGVISDTQLDITPESYLDEALSEYSNYNYRLANPVALNEYAEAENKNRFENSLLNLSVTPKFQMTKHLAISEHFSYTLVNTNEKYYIPINGVPSYYVTNVNGYRTNEVRSLFSKQNSVMSDTRVDWQNRYDAHNIQLFGGARINWENYTLNSQLGYNTGSDKTPFMSSSLLNATSTGTNDNWNSVAWYAQANYDYLGRYFLQANLTAESSSRFGKEAAGLKLAGVSWGLFPSAQASWVLTNEPWLANSKTINYLRLTTGFDVSGNDDIDYYAARSFLRSKLFLNAISGRSLSGIGNTEIKWETTRRFNAGLQSNLFNNRLHVNFNFFKSWTSDLLTLQSLSFLSGLDENWSNGGKLENVGFDVAASVKVLSLKNWQWEVGASMGHYKNKITELPDGQQYLDTELYGADIRSAVGQAANLFYGYETAGVFSTTEQANQAALYILDDNGVTKHYFGAGDVIFVDRNGDHIINAEDRTIIGDPNPDFYGNLFTTLSYKRFKLDARFNYSMGGDVYNYMRSQLESGSRFMNQTTHLVSRWQVEGQVTDVPRITFQDPMGNSRFSDRWIEDGSYLRLKTVTLSYDLPMRSSFLQGLQIWIQANNVFTLSKYLGSDPEFSMTTSVIGQGIDAGQIAQSRSFVAGVKINL
ncbi:MAG: SusC/RagA family TonB-linked outer membrane protein [Prevotella sp.]|nr:SusC/RagA family TonB-linked outer membrane protein [Prevotella sp.]